jgi:hypothetical protein
LGSPQIAGQRPFAQRSAEPGADEVPVARPQPEAVLQTSGQPLGDTTRSAMESQLGHDFSQVRVHTDAAAARSARSLSAVAYTAGDHIVFGTGQYAPSTAAGARILAHELAHVVQQREGPVDGRPGATGVRVSDPSDRFERAAHAAAGAVRRPTPGGPVPTAWPKAQAPAPAPSSVGTITVQRFEAGEVPTAHGGIEEAALHEAGLTKDEAKLAYYGNWLRDISQLSPGPAWDWVITTLATGMFGRTPSKEELGGYLPSEHLDRPEGGRSPEDPLRRQGTNEKTRPISGEQQKWVEEQHTVAFRERIRRARKLSGLPAWIEVGKEHAKRKLTEAVTLGRNAQGLQAMGDGLHAVEDYFSHSNFIEVALAQLADEGQLPRDSPSVKAMSQYVGIKDPAHLGKDERGWPQIVTGTAAPGGDKAVSEWELLKTEIMTGELTQTFVKGFIIRYGWQPGGAVGRALLGTVGGALGAAGGAVGGLAIGAGQGAASGWAHAKHWWQKPFAAVGGLFSGAVSGVAKGASAGWQAGQRVGGAIGQGVFGAAGAVLTGTVVSAVLIAASPFLAAVSAVLAAKAKGKIESATRQSARDAPPGTGPTHSQIAKDAPDHPLSVPARTLAHAADVAIGKAMIQAWAGSGPVEHRAAKVAALVDRYVAHPRAQDWWKPILLHAVGTGNSPHPVSTSNSPHPVSTGNSAHH